MTGSHPLWVRCRFGRVQTLLKAAIIEADPLGAQQRAASAAQERFVRLGRSSEHGLKLIIARAAAGDAIWFTAAIDRIADILRRRQCRPGGEAVHRSLQIMPPHLDPKRADHVR
jgi:hypothetical protein